MNILPRELGGIAHRRAELERVLAESETIQMRREALGVEALAESEIQQSSVVPGTKTPPLEHRPNEEHLVPGQADLLGDLGVGEPHVLALTLDFLPVALAVGIAVALLIVVAHAKDRVAESLDQLFGHPDLLPREPARHALHRRRLGV